MSTIDLHVSNFGQSKSECARCVIEYCKILNEINIEEVFSGDMVDVFYGSGTYDTPVFSPVTPDNTFSGFRTAPE